MPTLTRRQLLDRIDELESQLDEIADIAAREDGADDDDDSCE
jgi:hypothetical protein